MEIPSSTTTTWPLWTGADYSPIHDYQYSYDPVGNRLTQEEGLDVTSYTYNDEDRVLSQTFPDLSVINYFYDDIGKQPRFAAAAPPPATGYRRTGTGSVPGSIGPLDCSKISFTVYQRGGQSLIDVVGAPGAVPVRAGPPPYTQVRVDIAWSGTIWIQNTNAQGAFQRRGSPVAQFQQPFFIDVWYRDTVTLGLAGPCRIQ